MATFTMDAGLGWGALIIAGVGLIMVFGRLPDFLGSLGRSSEGGKWIRDRSLGGKMVGAHSTPSLQGSFTLLLYLIHTEDPTAADI